jgi:tryptophanyl-tRNA synthetase
MSKSNPNVHSKICILDPPNKIKKSIMKATTDSDGIVKYDEINKPGISNLLTIYSVLSDYTIPELEEKYEGCGYGDFKKDLVEVVQNALAPIQKRYHEILESGEILDILREGANKAEAVAKPVLERTRKALGFVPR